MSKKVPPNLSNVSPKLTVNQWPVCEQKQMKTHLTENMEEC